MGGSTIRSVAVFTQVAHGYYQGELCRELLTLARELNIRIHLIVTGQDSDYADTLSLNHIDAAIVVGNAISSHLLDEIQRRELPVVRIGCYNAHHHIDAVETDNEDGITQAFTSLHEQGHRQFSYVGNLNMTEMGERAEAFAQCQHAYGLSSQDMTTISVSSDSFHGGEQAVLELAKLPQMPTAVLCGNDLIAIGLIGQLQKRGWRVPQDIAVVGFDGSAVANSHRPSISSVHQDYFSMAEAAFELLIARSQTPTKATSLIKIPTKFVAAQSSDLAETFQAPAVELVDPMLAIRSRQAYFSTHENMRTSLAEFISLNHQFGEFMRFACLAAWQGESSTASYLNITEMYGDFAELDLHQHKGSLNVRPDFYPPEQLTEKYCNPASQVLTMPIRLRGELWGALTFAARFTPASRIEQYHQFVELVAQLAQRIERDLLEQLAAKHSKQTDRLQRRLQSVAQQASGGLWEWNLLSGEVNWNDRALELLGFAPDERRNRTRSTDFYQYMAEADVDVVKQRVDAHIQHGMPFSVSFRMLCQDGSVRWFSATGEAIVDRNGQAKRMLGSLKDVTDKRRNDQRFQMAASYDALTGLPNRSMISDQISQQLKAAPEQPLAVLQIGLDRFKHLNDRFGHEVGDRLLQHIASVLKKSLRDGDFFARFSGDEFICLCLVDNQRQAVMMANRLLSHIEQPLQKTLGVDYFVTASAGIALYPDHADASTNLLRNADMAMQQAKKSGKNQSVLFKQSLQLEHNVRARIDHELRKAIIKNELSLVYQPQISSVYGELVGVEALLRWHSSELGEVSPAEFIPMAEENGQIIELGLWVLKTACQTLRKWQLTASRPLTMSVNVSAGQLTDPNFLKNMTDVIHASGVDPRGLVVEITESTAISEMDNVRSLLEQLTEQGIRIALDDFGTGFSSISLLRQLPFNIIKIDRSFLKSLSRGSQDWYIVKAIQDLASALGHEVVAEGVETNQQLTLTRELQCDVVQGYVFSRPIPLKELEARYLLTPETKIRRIS
ncbi:EAL domain-containing protein [Neiella marina]|uniref:EAL domain-containing protein n=1 Tax=Neiella holothuriorum TaxID=2870530 RepID=A0ABS7EDS5_9GAMM|nr:EAL domain-containing protein [Neiella holothuriorum]MBW8190400.1 EAL domain-containing protein [Neiella holothuriorum]